MAKNIDYLVTNVRMLIGDTDASSYRYLDQWIVRALILSVKALKKYLGTKYLVSDSGYVSRDEYSTKFTTDEIDGVIEIQDEYIMALKAAIIILQGNLEQNAWSLTSWKDAEISVSNQEVSKVKSTNLKTLMDEFTELAGSPSKRLARVTKGSLPGYKGNSYETSTEY